MEYIDLLLFAGIALFLVLRLGSLLGKRTGNESAFTKMFRDFGPNRPETEEDTTTVITIDPEEDSSVWAPLRKADPDFDGDGFLEGARNAFALILGAYISGDMQDVKEFLADDVVTSFTDAIREREQNGQRVDGSLVGIESTDVTHVELSGTRARVTIHFRSLQTLGIYNQAGELVEGNPEESIMCNDIWSFKRDLESDDVNWILIGTGEN